MLATWRLPWLGGVVFVLLLRPLGAADVTVIDGDTIVWNGTRIRLDGIDAPELQQHCFDAAGAPWACGDAAKHALRNLLTRAPQVRCEVTGRDRYGRALAICFAGQVDIGASLVENGWALAFRRYSDRYVAAEGRARGAARGLWRGTFDPPWDWRYRAPTRP